VKEIDIKINSQSDLHGQQHLLPKLQQVLASPASAAAEPAVTAAATPAVRVEAVWVCGVVEEGGDEVGVPYGVHLRDKD
jgi:hypothetical protein